MKMRLFLSLTIVTIFMPSFMYGSVISSTSPWGTVAVWDTTLPFTGTTPNKCTNYNQQLDLAKACGLSWIRPNGMPICEKLPGNVWDFEHQDSIITLINRRNLNVVPPIWPPYWRRDSVSLVEYWNYQIEHYDGDGVGYGGIPEYDSAVGKPVKYWNMCHEPNDYHPAIFYLGDLTKPQIHPAVYQISPCTLSCPIESLTTDKTFFVPYSWCSLYVCICDSQTCKNFDYCDSLIDATLKDFCKYVRICGRRIQNLGGKVHRGEISSPCSPK